MPETPQNQPMVLSSPALQATLVELGLAQACLRRAYFRLEAAGGDALWIDALDNALNDISNAMDYAIGEHAEAALSRASI